MGGFEIAPLDGTGEPLQTLSPRGVGELAKFDIKPFMVSHALIEDRSKSDTLQKTLVLLQISWMAAQCIARKVHDLPITLLELHTMVHVVCAMLMYGFWFKLRERAGHGG